MRPFIPPAVLELWRRRRGTHVGLEFTSLAWAEAVALCGSYDNPVILENVEMATRHARANARQFERDGRVFDMGEVHWPVLGPLFEARSVLGGVLRVVDVGGSLASKWFQHAQFHEALAPIAWAVVEQPGLVNVAIPWLQDAQLTFHDTIESAAAHLGGIDVALFSASLQYFRDPMTALESAASLACHSVIVDRMPSWDRPEAHLAIQSVGLYSKPVCYPCWVMSEPEVLGMLGRAFETVARWREPMPMDVRPAGVGIGWLGVAGIGRRS